MNNNYFEPVAINAMSTDSLASKYVSSRGFIFRFNDGGGSSQDANYESTEISVYFPAPNTSTETAIESVLTQMTYPTVKEIDGVGMASTCTSMGFLDTSGRFYVYEDTAKEMKTIDTCGKTFKQMITNTTHFCCLTVHNDAYFFDARGTMLARPDMCIPAVRRVIANAASFAVETDHGVYIAANKEAWKIPCPNIIEIKPLHDGKAFVVRTANGTVWIETEKGGTVLGVDSVTQIAPTVSELVFLKSDGSVMTYTYEDKIVHPVISLPRILHLVYTTTTVMAIADSGQVYTWNAPWIAAKTSETNTCEKTACLVYDLNIHSIRSANTSKFNWMLNLGDYYFSLGEFSTIGAVCGLDSANVLSMVSNAYAHAFLCNDGSVFVVGSPNAGGTNENGMPGLMRLDDQVSEVTGKYTKFVAINEDSSTAFVWGDGQSEIHQYADYEQISNVYITPRNVYTLTNTNKLNHIQLVEEDIPTRVLGMVHTKSKIYLGLACHKFPMCKLVPLSTIVLDGVNTDPTDPTDMLGQLDNGDNNSQNKPGNSQTVTPVPVTPPAKKDAVTPHHHKKKHWDGKLNWCDDNDKCHNSYPEYCDEDEDENDGQEDQSHGHGHGYPRLPHHVFRPGKPDHKHKHKHEPMYRPLHKGEHQHQHQHLKGRHFRALDDDEAIGNSLTAPLFPTTSTVVDQASPQIKTVLISLGFIGLVIVMLLVKRYSTYA